MSKITEIKKYSDIAFAILERDTHYIRSKKIISDIFKINREDRFETILFRLTVIDSYYSTQMNKRFFGLDDLANKIKEISYDDRGLKKKSSEYIANVAIENGIRKLLTDTYGIHKTGHDFGQATSLISKYLYFLTGYNFPIYDNLVRLSHSLIKEKYPELNLNNLNKKFDHSYFENIKYLNAISEINDYNKLDNFLWLIGKLTEGSLSLILNKERYRKLIGKINIPKGTESRETDKMTREYIRDNIKTMTDIFNENELTFLKYCFYLNS